MHNLKVIRVRLGITQQAMADGLGCTQANVGHYERGQAMPSEMARRLIDFAGTLGLVIGFDHVYGSASLPKLTQTEPTEEEASHG
ncbi:helix-turn-helix domain-containing protein [Diaphorobacter caeni]|uniref:helix-turn-helix domain-containing protein n=1 Tax=Diaphorobacter caeni TaxID=2784387 RepID=UPI00188F3E9E|nr:helix-turn-helix transcriptional regulator [Diaphorobacter caeni]MBF5006877.1 helix-turn-helix transcriptional regulator [Diaphorobacter caeni]